MAAQAKVDWFAVRKEYIQDSTVSYADLAVKYGVSKKSVSDRGVKEGWLELRQSLSEKAFVNFQNKLLGEKSKAQHRHLSVWQRFQRVAQSTLEGMEAEENGVEPKALKALAGAMRIAIDGERIVLGLPTTVGAITDPDGRPIVPVAIYDLNVRKSENDTSSPDSKP